jgi:hypothetical protein
VHPAGRIVFPSGDALVYGERDPRSMARHAHQGGSMAGEKRRGAPKKNAKKPSKAAKLKQASKLAVRTPSTSADQPTA